MKLVILGAGQYGMVARDVAEATGRYESIAFLDDASDLGVGRLDDIEAIDYDEAFIAIRNPTVRRQYADRVKKLATLDHPTAVVMGTVGEGSIIPTGAVVGRCSIIMGGAVIGHNAIVGDFCQIRYNAVMAERVTIRDGFVSRPDEKFLEEKKQGRVWSRVSSSPLLASSHQLSSFH